MTGSNDEDGPFEAVLGVDEPEERDGGGSGERGDGLDPPEGVGG